MSHTPAIALATEIASQIGSLTLGDNILHSSVRAPDADVPVNCVFVWEDAGLAALRTMGEVNEIRRTLVVVRVRNAKHANGNTLALSIMNSIRAVSISTYLDVVAATSGPRMLGQSDEGHHYFGFEYLMVYQEP